jgi:hypothetical protein
MTREVEVHETLDLFLGRFGIPEALISDGAKSYTGDEYRKKNKQASIFCKLTDPYSPWQNCAESEIREVKRLASKWTVKSQSPRRLWDHAIGLASIVRSHLASDMYKQNGQVTETIMLGQTCDICFICSFDWYDWVYYNKQNAVFPASKMTLGRYLGSTDPEAGSVLSAKNLTIEGNVIRRNTFRHLTPIENDNLDLITAKANFTAKVNSRLGDPIKEHLAFNDLANISSVTLSNDKSI